MWAVKDERTWFAPGSRPAVEGVSRGHSVLTMPVSEVSVSGMEGVAPLTGDSDRWALLHRLTPWWGTW